MKPKGKLQSEYVRMLEALEKMAELYKQKPESPGRGNGGCPRFVRILRQLRKNGPSKCIKKWRIERSGIDLPLYSAEEKAAFPYRDYTEEEGRYFSEERIAVYMAMFGGYDRIREPLIQPDNVDYYLISDRPADEGSAWNRLDPAKLVPEEYLSDPVLSNRWCKLHPHELFPDHRLSVYVDSNFLIVSDLTALTAGIRDFPAAMFLHKNRNCVYDEIRACRIKKKVPEALLKKHEQLLRRRGVPEKYGLLEAPVIARRHMEPVCIRFMEHWWKAYLEGCGRDQISLIDCMWKDGIRVEEVGTLGYDFRDCHLLIAMPHGSKEKK